MIVDQDFFVDVRYLTAIGDIATNVQSFRRHVKEKHVWFYDNHLRRYERGSVRNNILMTVDNFLETEHENFNQDEVMGNEEQIEGDDNSEGGEEILSYTILS